MARNHARILTSIWTNPGFIALSREAQVTYLLALSQPSLSFCGVVSYTTRRWSRMAAGTSEADVEAVVVELELAEFVVVDRDTEELWVRSFVKHDGILDSPNMVTAMWKDYTAILSPDIARRFLRNLPDKAWDKAPERVVCPGEEPSPIPSGNPSPIPSGNPSPNPSGKGYPTPAPSPTPSPSPAPPLAGTGSATPPAVPSAAVPIKNRLSEPSSFVEIVEPGGRVAVLREAGAILDAVDKLATERLLPDERRKLRPVVADALKAGYDPKELAEAIASSPFRTQAGVIGELRKRKQPPQTRKSVGDTGLTAAATWLQRQEGA